MRWTLALAAPLLLQACSLPPRSADFQSIDPAERTLAIGRAASQRPDPAATRALIGLLESEDPAERMLAIRTLERQTGQTLGYDYSASEPSRAAAVGRWDDWARDQGLASLSASPPVPPR